MAFVQFSDVSLAFGDRDILKNVSLSLQSGSKAALAGANGAGKSTLIKVIAGVIAPDSGARAVQKGARIGYLPQSGLTHAGCTLWEEADRAFSAGYELQAQIDALGEELARSPAHTQTLAERQASLIQQLDDSGWHRRAAVIESVLSGLGFSRDDFSRMTETFSGGWQMRIALATLLMQRPDILLLDEPTNYLDLEARTWLEQFLQEYDGGFLVVSHDRYFLDVTVTEVYEVFCGTVRRYTGNFSCYEKTRATEIASLMAQYERQQREIQRLEDLISRFGAKATKAAQAQSWQKQLDKIERITVPEAFKPLCVAFPPAPHAGKVAAVLSGVTKTYDGAHMVLDNVDVQIDSGERLAVVGQNGAGKTTLLKIIAGVDTHYSGSCTLGTGIQVGYFSQDSAERITGSDRILDYIASRAPMKLIPLLRDMLGAFLFRGDDVFKSLSVLSGGEKSRVALLELLLRPVNLLVLDEPTNHLDMYAKDALLAALDDFGGTVVFVSHDRGFIEGLSTRVLEVRSGGCRLFAGDYRYYSERRAQEAAAFAEEQDVFEKKHSSAVQSLSSGQRDWQAEKRRKAEMRKQEKDIARLESTIAELEERQATLERALADPAVYSDGEKSRAIQQDIQAVSEQLSLYMNAWERAVAEQ
ncbi:MAG: ABC-F family ATP-binding cassette domain-containing protein [Treponema sp.]|nr:ABC-F family ATP-binding cassette domain-containing protein [Treponema sp.]